MKNILYKLYALSFNFFALFPLRKNRVVLLSPHMASFKDSLGEMEKEMQRRGYKTVRIAGSDIRPKSVSVKSILRMLRFFTKSAYDLATANIVFLNDNFMPMADLHIKKQTVYLELWHAEGAFKRFGLDIDGLDEEVRNRVVKGNRKLSYVICSGPGVTGVYASAFGVPAERVRPLGSPRADRYIAQNAARQKDLRQKLFGEESRKIVLYAPTFRDDHEENRVLLHHFDFDAFEKRFGDRYRLVVRLHPQFGRNTETPDGICDMTSYPDGSEIIAASDILITDYSSICMDFALVDKPCVFYAYDLDRYCGERNFYFDYKKYVPGAVAETFDDLLTAMETVEADRDALHHFVECNFGTPDGNSARRIADLAIQTANDLSR